MRRVELRPSADESVTRVPLTALRESIRSDEIILLRQNYFFADVVVNVVMSNDTFSLLLLISSR
jgi:hypothetical protein